MFHASDERCPALRFRTGALGLRVQSLQAVLRALCFSRLQCGLLLLGLGCRAFGCLLLRNSRPACRSVFFQASLGSGAPLFYLIQCRIVNKEHEDKGHDSDQEDHEENEVEPDLADDVVRHHDTVDV